MIFRRQHLTAIVLCLLIGNCLLGCGGILETPSYDALTVKQATTISMKVHKLFIKIVGSDEEHKKYKHHKTTYGDILIDLRTLLTLTEAREDKDIEQVVKKCIIYLKQNMLMHKGKESEAKQLSGMLGEGKVEEAFKESKRFYTSATPEEMNAKYPAGELDIDIDTLLNQLRILTPLDLTSVDGAVTAP